MKCSKCHKEVEETIHSINGVKVGWYGAYTTRAEKIGKSREGHDLFKGWVEPEEITCKECYDRR